jgi:serine phosphatase RsbU (regulator of sigma subunit)
MRPSWGALAKWVAALILTAVMLGMLYTQSRPPAHDLHTESMRIIQETERENAHLIQETLRLRVELSEAYGRLNNVRDRLVQNNQKLRPAMQASIGQINESLDSELEALTQEVLLQHQHVEDFKLANTRMMEAIFNRTEEYEAQRTVLVDEHLHAITQSKVSDRLNAAQVNYDRAFVVEVDAASLYRIVLYGWSVVFLIALIITLYRFRQLSYYQEQLVVQRTAELDDALSSLWGEMELATRIQTALVPAKPLLHGCDVAASMFPAEIVGGDYYDFVNVGEVDWVLIGDVSGHGVPAGLIMMMCQTAVQTELQAHPELEPNVLLGRVNHTLVENMRRLGEQKYMTLTAMRRDPDGTFHFAGLHQDLFIRRAATGKVERIASQGTWIGLMHDIASSLPVGQFSLHSGDVLCLYTDGITEAQKDNTLLENDGLAALLENSKGKTAEDILESILQPMETYEIDDDVSVVVIRQV